MSGPAPALASAPVRAPGAPAPALLLQRACACGNNPGVHDECEECRAKNGVQTKLVVGGTGDRYEQEADRIADQVVRGGSVAAPGHALPQVQRLGPAGPGAGAAPPVVHEALSAPGRALEPAVRGDMERRFAHDFSRVRVHTGPTAERSAGAVHAHAYTVGSDVVFAAGRYAPGTHEGRRLLAHELTHVVQQSGGGHHGPGNATVQRNSVSPPVRGPHEDEDAAEARRRAEEGAHGAAVETVSGTLQRQPDDEFWRLDVFGGPAPSPERDRIRAETQTTVEECMAQAGPDPDECTPSRALTWADFSGSVPAGSTFGALTASGLRERAINVARRRCDPTAAALKSKAVQAQFTPSSSWVKPMFANPSSLTDTGCNTPIADCTSWIGGNPGGTWALDTSPSTTCPASAVPRGDTATSVPQCTTVVGTDCTDRAAAESARLLRHEQGHFNITCAMARKANAMTYTDATFPALLTAAQTRLSQVQGNYDTQTNHGCNAGQQSTWETAISGGLPAVTITVGGTP